MTDVNKPAFELDPMRGKAFFLAQIATELGRRRIVYLRGFTPHQLSEGSLKPLRPSVFSHLVGHTLDLTQIDRQGNQRPYELTPRDVECLCQFQGYRDKLPIVEVCTSVPLVNLRWQFAQPGYNPDSKVFYTGPEITPRDSCEHTNKILGAFPWKRPSDRANHLAVMATGVLALHLQGQRPMEMIRGNKPAVGKTTLAYTLFLGSSEMPCISYDHNDASLEKHLASTLPNNSAVLIDNIRTPSNREISSPSLERTLTSESICFRLLGTNNMVTGPNLAQLCGTFNNGRLGTDLWSRCVVIELFVQDDPVQAQILKVDGMHVTEYMKLHRVDVLGELLGMIKRWRDAGAPEVPRDFRFRKWASLLGGILQVNGVEGFLKNQDEDRMQHDSVQAALAVLAFASEGQPMRATQCCDLLEDRQMLPDDFDGIRKARAKQTKMGQLLKGHVGRVIRSRSDGEELGAWCTLKSHRDRNGEVYIFEPVEPRTTPPAQVPAPVEPPNGPRSSAADAAVHAGGAEPRNLSGTPGGEGNPGLPPGVPPATEAATHVPGVPQPRLPRTPPKPGPSFRREPLASQSCSSRTRAARRI